MVSWYGRVEYERGLREMERLRRRMVAGEAATGTLILCEHPPTITCGKHSRPENVLYSGEECARRGISIERIERGGDVTYHGPGQLMIYPVVDVGVKVRGFLETVAGALAEIAASFGVPGARWNHEEAGLWLGERKLAACGLNLKRGVSIHGFALNVCTPPEAWHCINPCGLSGPPPISLAEASGRVDIAPEEVAEIAQPRLALALKGYGLDPDARADLP